MNHRVAHLRKDMDKKINFCFLERKDLCENKREEIENIIQADLVRYSLDGENSSIDIKMRFLNAIV